MEQGLTKRIKFSDFYKPKPKQAVAHKCKSKYILFGGAMGGGKSWWLCAESILNALLFPGNRLVLVRETFAVLRTTTMVTFGKICPPELLVGGRITGGEARFKNGSVIIFMGVDMGRDPLLQRLKGLEVGWAGIDEANETPEEVFNILKARLRWVLPNGQTPRYAICLTSNPESCWLKPRFIYSPPADHEFIQSLTTDNYDEDSEYIKTLRDAFRGNVEMERRYLGGSWEDSDAANQLIGNESIKSLWIERYFDDYDPPWSLGVDVARFGDDKTVMVLLHGGRIHAIFVYEKKDLVSTADEVMRIADEFGVPHNRIGIDAVGMGSGVVDICRNRGYDVKEIVGGAEPDNHLLYRFTNKSAFRPNNLRTHLYWLLAEEMQAGELYGGGHLETNIREPLEEELASIRYDFAADKVMKVLSKTDIKKRIGRSPDFADALAYANYMRMQDDNYILMF